MVSTTRKRRAQRTERRPDSDGRARLPVVHRGVHAQPAAGSPVIVAGRVLDPGTDTGTLTIDWGDGSPTTTLDIGCDAGDVCPTQSLHPAACVIPPATGTGCGYFDASHLYAAGGTFVITVTATDDDGGSDTESTSATVAAVDTAPTITASATSGGLPYLAGNWTNQDVVVHFECGDDSGTVDCPIDVTVTTEGTTPFVDGTATDGTGHSTPTTFGPIQIDRTAPSITASATTADGQPYVAGTWTDQAVTVDFECTDGPSGLASCSPDAVVSTDGANQQANGTATDRAGNTNSTSFGPINIDTSDPSITASATSGGPPVPRRQLDEPGRRRALRVRRRLGDASLPADETVSAEGATTSVLGTAIDGNGQTSSTTFGPIQDRQDGPGDRGIGRDRRRERICGRCLDEPDGHRPLHLQRRPLGHRRVPADEAFAANGHRHGDRKCPRSGRQQRHGSVRADQDPQGRSDGVIRRRRVQPAP